jgi:excisionase family DNA binding protein
MESRHPKSADELLHSDHYTAEELAALLEIGVNIVRHAVYAGELPAQVVGHTIVSIRREDVLAWYATRQRDDAASS